MYGYCIIDIFQDNDWKLDIEIEEHWITGYNTSDTGNIFIDAIVYDIGEMAITGDSISGGESCGTDVDLYTKMALISRTISGGELWDDNIENWV